MKQTLKYIYERLLDSFKLAETKYSITIALASGVIVFGSTFLSQTEMLAKIFSASCVIFALISVLYGFIALTARRIKLPVNKKPKNIENLMYYKIIIKFDEFNYISEIKKRYQFPNSYKPDELDYDLARQIITLSKIINIKYIYFNLSITFLFISVLFGVGLTMLGKL